MPSYSSYLRQMAVLDVDDDIQWITVKGNHIPIKSGQSKEDAVKEFFEAKESGGKSESAQKKNTFLSNPNTLKEFANHFGISESAAKRAVEKYGDEFYNTMVKEPVKGVGMAVGGEKIEQKVDNSKNSGKVYSNSMSKIRNFKSKEEGTFDFETGKPKNYPNGYSVSFHQNEPDANGK